MKKLLLLTFLLLSGCVSNKQFYMGDSVQVTNGFYKGCSGIVTKEQYKLITGHTLYTLTYVQCINSTYVSEISIQSDWLNKQ